MLCEAMPLWLEADQVIFSVSFDSKLLFHIDEASATTTLVMLGGGGGSTLNVPVLLELRPFESVAWIV
jgi:hypothetical protein